MIPPQLLGEGITDVFTILLSDIQWSYIILMWRDLQLEPVYAFTISLILNFQNLHPFIPSVH